MSEKELVGKIIGMALLGSFPHINGKPLFEVVAEKYKTTVEIVEQAYKKANRYPLVFEVK